MINDSPFVLFFFLQIMIPFSELSIYRLELGYLSWNLPTRVQVVDMAWAFFFFIFSRIQRYYCSNDRWHACWKQDICDDFANFKVCRSSL
jgi:hypothetical protein